MKMQEILDRIKAAFQTIIKERNFHPTRLQIELSEYGTVHIYMTTPEFSGKTETERNMMIWPALEKRLVRKIIMHISACVLLAPEEDPDFAEQPVD